MSQIPAVNSALTGIYSGMQSAASNTTEVVNRSVDGGNVAEPLIGLKQDQLQVEASAKALQTSNEMLGSLLDIKV